MALVITKLAYLASSVPSPGLWSVLFFFFTQTKTATTIVTTRTTITRRPPIPPPTAGNGILELGPTTPSLWVHSVSPRLCKSTKHSGSTFNWTPWTTTVGLSRTHACSANRRSVLFFPVMLMILPWSITSPGCSGLQTSLPSATYSVVMSQLHNSFSCRVTCSIISDNFSTESSCCIWKWRIQCKISDPQVCTAGCIHDVNYPELCKLLVLISHMWSISNQLSLHPPPTTTHAHTHYSTLTLSIQWICYWNLNVHFSPQLACFLPHCHFPRHTNACSDIIPSHIYTKRICTHTLWYTYHPLSTLVDARQMYLE